MLQRKFLVWSKSLLDATVNELVAGRDLKCLDLSDTLIVVATSETARRLKEALAVRAAECDSAAFVPHVWSPEVVLTAGEDRSALATPLQERLIWSQILGLCHLPDYSNLFPTPPLEEQSAWALSVAQTLCDLRRMTGAGGLRFADVYQALASTEDAARWQELAQLEQLYSDQLQRLGWGDMLIAKRKHAEQPVLPEGVKRVVTFALMDPPQLLRQWLKTCSVSVPVEVWVYADPELQHTFDELGVPLANYWTRQLDLPLANAHIELVQDELEQAQACLRWLKEKAATSKVAVGLADPTLADPLVHVLQQEGVKVYDPAGYPARSHQVMGMLQAWLRFLMVPSWQRMNVWLRHADVLQRLAQQAGLSHQAYLKQLDEVTQKHQPHQLSDAIQVLKLQSIAPPLLTSLESILAQKTRWLESEFGELLSEFLLWIYASKNFVAHDAVDQAAVQLLVKLRGDAEALQDSIREMQGRPSSITLLAILVNEVAQQNLDDRRGEVDLILRGWLELLWEPDPSLVVAGFNDQNIPGIVGVNAFLPDRVCEQLGLSCQNQRWARDAYLLRALAEYRQTVGALHLIMGRSNAAGDILRPSRLIFACPDEDLVQRVKWVYEESGAVKDQAIPGRGLAWKLRLPNEERVLEQISPTSLNDYLKCPTRYYLKHVLKMRSEPLLGEDLGSREFGVLVHDVLQSFGRDSTARDFFDELKIQNYFKKALLDWRRQNWGLSQNLALRLFEEVVEQRLMYAAKIQAELRNEGWRIHDVEFQLNATQNTQLAGVTLNGRIDRLDQHRDGRWRIIDYKTANQVKKPDQMVSSNVSSSYLEDPMEAWKCYQFTEDKVSKWTDLQLPLYLWAMQQQQPNAVFEAGYFNLPAAVAETQFQVYQPSLEHLENAVSTACEAIRRIQQGVFWPPAETLKYDDFEDLFLNLGGEVFDATANPLQSLPSAL